MSIFLKGHLTVFYDHPYWIGIIERWEDNALSVCRIVFGPEPKDYEIYELLSQCYYDLKFSSGLEDVQVNRKMNPKRMQRQVRKSMTSTGVRKKAWDAIQQEREKNKLEKKKKSSKKKAEEKHLRFEMKKQKKKEKRKGH